MHDELTEDYRDMIYADTAAEVHKRRKAFLRKWRLKCHAVADSLQEARDKLFTLTRLPQNQWKSARTTNAIERLNEAFKRRIKNADRTAFPRDRANVVLGTDGLWTDPDAQGRWLENARSTAQRNP